MSPLALAAVDLDAAGRRPARLSLLPLHEAGRTREWPGDPPAELRRFARGRTLLVCGGAAEREAFLRWLGAEGAGDRDSEARVFSLDALLRRAGGRIPRRAADPEVTPRERAEASRDAAEGVMALLLASGILDGARALEWLRGGEAFDFGDRLFAGADLAAVPAAPGTYRFYDRAGALVYVGQSKNLRTRVGSYFRTKTPARQAAIAARAHRLEIREAGSDLGALVREASEIRRLKPAMNRQVAVHERASPYEPGPAGVLARERIYVLPGAEPGRRDVVFVHAGAVVERRQFTVPRAGGGLTSGRRSWQRALRLIERHYFQAAGAPLRGGPSSRSTAEATRLLATWVRRGGREAPAFDPTDCRDAREAASRLVEMLAEAQGPSTPPALTPRMR